MSYAWTWARTVTLGVGCQLSPHLGGGQQGEPVGLQIGQACQALALLGVLQILLGGHGAPRRPASGGYLAPQSPALDCGLNLQWPSLGGPPGPFKAERSC